MSRQRRFTSAKIQSIHELAAEKSRPPFDTLELNARQQQRDSGGIRFDVCAIALDQRPLESSFFQPFIKNQQEPISIPSNELQSVQAAIEE